MANVFTAMGSPASASCDPVPNPGANPRSGFPVGSTMAKLLKMSTRPPPALIDGVCVLRRDQIANRRCHAVELTQPAVEQPHAFVRARRERRVRVVLGAVCQCQIGNDRQQLHVVDDRAATPQAGGLNIRLPLVVSRARRCPGASVRRFRVGHPVSTGRTAIGRTHSPVTLTAYCYRSQLRP